MNRQMIDPIKNRVLLMIGRAIINFADDTKSRQKVQFNALLNETKESVERVQNYGFTSHPLAGAEGVFVCVGGNRDHALMIAADDPRHRMHGLQEGEVALYTDEGDYIILKRGRIIEIYTETLKINATTKIEINSPLLECSGDITDQKDSGGQSMAAMRGIYNTHTHTETDTTTQPPNQEMGA
jgi:phage baseplate assembly protein V